MSATSDIDGDTRIVVIVANPISHVRTPQRMNAHLRAGGVNAVVVPVHVTKCGLASVLDGCRKMKNLDGIIVTVPHKIDITGLCDCLDDTARLVGAANVIRRDGDGRLIGANFDGTGFVRSICDHLGSVEGKSIFMVGAGGVARAIAFAFAQAGAGRIAIANRTTAKAEALANAVAKEFAGTQMSVWNSSRGAPEDFDVALNASTIGLHDGDPLPFALDRLDRNVLVADVIMQPLITPLLDAARRLGHPICTGDGMLDHQLVAFCDFLGLSPPGE